MIVENFRRIQQQIQMVSGGRTIKIIGASKMVRAEKIREAYDTGLHCFGENRIQEAVEKLQHLPEDIEWHFIGHLQSNKAKDAVRYFSWIHSVDSARLLHVLGKEAQKQRKNIQVLIEINLAQEETKHGAAPDAVDEILQAGAGQEYVHVCGLMAIPPYFEDTEQVRPYFRKLREISLRYPMLTELSMGMSQDYAVAIEEGATMVRIGTALFGARPQR